MPNLPYDDRFDNNTPPVGEEETPIPENGEEEFDISSFDFTIADPWETEDGSAQNTESEMNHGEDLPEEESVKEESFQEIPEEPKKKFSLKGLSDALTEKVTKLMEEPEKEPKPRKKKEISFAGPFQKKVRDRSVPSKEETPDSSAVVTEIPVAPEEEKVRFTGGTFRQVSRRWLRYALRPGTLYENISEKLWPLFLALVMAFFGAFYLLLGLDWYFAHLVSLGRLFAIAGVGLLVGGTAAMAFAAGTLGLSMFCRKERLRPFRILSTAAGACVYPAFLLLTGFLIQIIFHASVSMSFGITAVLWFFYLLLDVLRELFGEKHLFKSTAFLVVWGFVLFLIMSWTFTLK